MSKFVKATALETAVITCSEKKADSPFMHCIAHFDPWTGHRRHCLNVAGFPQSVHYDRLQNLVSHAAKVFREKLLQSRLYRSILFPM